MEHLNIPWEIFIKILTFVDHKTQVHSCSLVNKEWRKVVINETLRKRAILLDKINNKESYSWYCYYYILGDTFNRNFIKNPNGSEELKNWIIEKPPGNFVSATWCPENPPKNCAESLPTDDKAKVLFCFVSCCYDCIKYQDIDLYKHFSPKFIKESEFNITASVWIAPRRDCGAFYKLKISLLNENREEFLMDEKECNFSSPNDGIWNQVIIDMKNKPCLRYIRFWHLGKDTQFWDDCYGIKTTECKIMLSLPQSK